MSSKTSSKKNKKHTKHVCRTCMLKHKNVSSIFCMDISLNVGYDVIVSTVTGIEIKTEDMLTNYICPMCKQSAKAAYLFIKQAKDSDTSLRNGVTHIKKEKDPSKKHKKSKDLKVDVKIENYDAVIKSENCFDDNFDADFDDGYTSPLDNTALSEIKKYEVGIEEYQPQIKTEKSNYCPVCGESFPDAFALLNHACMCAIVKSNDTSTPENYLKIGKIKTPKQKKKSRISIKLKNRPSVSISKVASRSKKSRPAPEVEYVQDFTGIPRCGICSMLFDNQQQLEKHFSKHTALNIIKCSICSKNFMEPMYVRRHLQSHPQQDVVSMDTQVNSVSIENVLKTATGELHLSVCPLCGELQLTLNDLRTHNAAMHPEFIHRCSNCHMVFNNESCITKHAKNCIGRNTHECTICNMKFARDQYLQSHIKLKHLYPRPDNNASKPLPCYICDSRFDKVTDLEKHKYRWHKPTIDGKILYECDICHYRSDSKYNLGSHINNVHLRLKPREANHVCQFCGKRTTSVGNLKVHIRRFHTGEKPYKCNYCEKCFVRSLDRNMHERTHTGYKPYSCQYCGWRFCKSSALKQHIRVHTGEKPYKCSHCGQGFAQCHDKTKHERRHTGEVAYSCLCGSGFLKARELQAHRLTCSLLLAQSMDPDIDNMKQQMQRARTYLSAFGQFQ